MGYRALLFCPDDKTSRTVTQVLSELEFSVEASTEPFAAVKKLMGEHFDAIVVDCDNEQNATLLFKSARNSTSNQASLAVAVVEGQAGVAKAFRIGANLVLTKPINVEQAKGTLRVARGLLRKGDPAKVAPPSPSVQGSIPAITPPAPAKIASPKTVPGTVAQRSEIPGQLAKPSASPVPPLTATAHDAAASRVSDTNDDDDLFDVDEPAAATSTKNASNAASPLKTGTPFSKLDAPTGLTPPSPAVKSVKNPVSPSSALSIGSSSSAGTTSAAAPARSPEKIAVENVISAKAAARSGALFEKPTEAAKAESSHSLVNVPAPSFSMGGDIAGAEGLHGGGKKALIGAAAVVIVAAASYAGWSQFHGKINTLKEPPKPAATATLPPAPVSAATPKVSPTIAPSGNESSSASSSSSSPAQLPAPPTHQKLAETPSADNSPHSSDKPPASKGAAKALPSSATSASTPSSDLSPADQPIVVKSGASIKAHASAQPSDAAPSALEISPSSSDSALSNLLSNSDTSKPVLQTVNVSQGVSQGLLIKKVQPNYPPTAIRMHLEGAVQLQATVAKTGNITAVKILSGEPILAQSAIDAVKQWKYRPYTLNGEPVEIQTQVTINFKLPR